METWTVTISTEEYIKIINENKALHKTLYDVYNNKCSTVFITQSPFTSYRFLNNESDEKLLKDIIVEFSMQSYMKELRDLYEKESRKFIPKWIKRILLPKIFI